MSGVAHNTHNPYPGHCTPSTKRMSKMNAGLLAIKSHRGRSEKLSLERSQKYNGGDGVSEASQCKCTQIVFNEPMWLGLARVGILIKRRVRVVGDR